MAVAALALCLSGPASAAPGYRWHAENGPLTVQWGIPGSDDRALRVDCDGRGGLSLGGPILVEAEEGDRVTVRVASALGSERLTGVVVAAGDGLNFDTPVAAGGVTLRSLLAGKTIRLGGGRDSYVVPGAGSQTLLRRLIRDCAARGP